MCIYLRPWQEGGCEPYRQRSKDAMSKTCTPHWRQHPVATVFWRRSFVAILWVVSGNSYLRRHWRKAITKLSFIFLILVLLMMYTLSFKRLMVFPPLLMLVVAETHVFFSVFYISRKRKKLPLLHQSHILFCFQFS